MSGHLFVWTLKDVIEAVFLGLFLLALGFIGCLLLIDKIQRKWRAWRSR